MTAASALGACPGFRLTTLGSVSLACVNAAGARSILGPGKPLALVSYLALSPRPQASRDHLVDLLWSDVSPKAGDQSLRQAVSSLRKLLSDDALVSADGIVTLSHPLPSDRDAFLAAVEEGALEDAACLYQGEFLPLLALPGGARFEQWADAERYRIRLIFIRTAETVARQWLSAGRAREAQRLARRVRDADPDDERGWRLLLESLLSGNDALGAAVEADALERLLSADEREPDPSTTALLRLARHSTAAPSEPESPRRMGAELIGREREFSAVIEAWDASRRGPGQHVHVSASAGIGKTRLLADVYARLRAGGARVIQIRANAGERRIPNAVTAELAARLCELPGATGVSPGTRGLLVGLNPAVSARLNAAADASGSAEELLRRRTAAIVELMEAAADEAPFALLVDDVHWADAASRQVLQGVANRVTGIGVLLLSAARPSPEGRMSAPATLALSLEPLSPAGIGSLIASLGALPQQDWATTFPDELHRATGGSPLLALETLQLLCERDVLELGDREWQCRSPEALAAGLGSGSALANRLAQLDREDTWLLLLLGVAGTPLDDDTLTRAASQPAEHIHTTLSGLEVRGLVQRAGPAWRPAHDEIAAIAVDRAAPAALKAAHAAIAGSLAAPEDVDVDTLVRAGQHLLASGSDGRLEQLFQRCVTCARRRGDTRSVQELALGFVADSSDEARAQQLVSSLPMAVRWAPLVTARAVAGIALVAVASAGVTMLLSRRAAPPPDATLLIIERTADGSASAIEVPVKRDGWPVSPELQPSVGGRQYRRPFHADVFDQDISSTADGHLWALSRPIGDSGSSSDLFVSSAIAERRLTFTHGDDLSPSWSPDHRHIAFRTTRWNPHAWADIAVLDVRTGRTRQVTRGDGVDAGPSWSPDGTRIAFIRGNPGGNRDGYLCWVRPDGSEERCLPTAALYQRAIGWYDAREALVLVRTAMGQGLARVDMDRGTYALLAEDSLFSAYASADGRWIACECQSPGQTSSEWRIFPVDNPERIARLPVLSRASRRSVRWLMAAHRQAFIDRIAIREPHGPLPAGASFKLVAEAFDSAFAHLPVGRVSWSSMDRNVATVNDSTGLLLPLRAGTVMIRASAGGWRSDWIRLTIGGPASSTLMTEAWDGRLDSQWVPFGEPRPSIVQGPGELSGMLNGGDGTYESGVYSRRAFDGRAGLGVDVRLSTPGNAIQYQQVTVWLAPHLDSLSLRQWDHRTGYVPGTDAGEASCVLVYPVGDGPAERRRFNIGGHRPMAASPRIRSGAWYTARLQIFPDGRCGVAIDGVPKYKTTAPLQPGRGYRVLLQGSSVGTKMLVGPIEVWDGVRTDVDWSKLNGSEPR